MQPSERQTGEILKANTDEPLAPDPDGSGLKIAPAPMVWIATALETLINAALRVLDALLRAM